MFGMKLLSGSMYDFRKNMELQAKYVQRREAGFAKKDDKPASEWDSLYEQAKQVREQYKDPASMTTASIQAKIRSGQKLSPGELQYLKDNNPEMYEQVMKSMREQEQYSKELKNCKTKDDVRNLHTQKMLSAANELGTIKNNPNIPAEKKLEMCQIINGKVNMLNEEYQKFVAEEKFKNLPTQAEKAEQAEEENTSAAEAAQEVDSSNPTENKDKESDEKTDETDRNTDSEITEHPAPDMPTQASSEVFKADTHSAISWDTKVLNSQNKQAEHEFILPQKEENKVCRLNKKA